MRTHGLLSLLTITACATPPDAGDDDLDVSTESNGKADGTRASYWTVRARATDTQLGQAVLPADLDGDGRLDLVIGAPGPDKVHVYLATDDGLPERPDTTIAGPQGFGWTLVRIPREGGDCFAATASVEPHVSVYCGVEGTRVWMSTGPLGVASSYNLWQVAAGDINGDGKPDLVISESGHRGRVWAIDNITTYSVHAAWEIEGNRDYARLGDALVVADFDADGYDDLAVGAPADNAGEHDGYVRLYRGSPAGFATTPAWTRRGPGAYAHYGRTLAASDVNGDGRPDLLVGYADDARGRIDVYHAAGSTFSPGPARTLRETGTGELSRFGAAIAGADLDGDGYGDVIVGEPNHDRVGRVLVYRGGASGLAATPRWTKSGSPPGNDFGTAIAGADVDGDGKADLVIGEPLYASPSGGGSAANAGRVHVFSAALL